MENPRCKLHPDPVARPPNPRLLGCGPNGSYRALHHQCGKIGEFHVRLLEGRGLNRKHWSPLSIGPMRHLGLSRAHGEVSSYATFRLAFWQNGYVVDNTEGTDAREQRTSGLDGSRMQKHKSSANSSALAPSESSVASSMSPSQHSSFLPTLPAGELPSPFEGSLRGMSPARSPCSPFFAARGQRPDSSSYGAMKHLDSNSPKPPTTHMPMPKEPKPAPIPQQTKKFGPDPPHHYSSLQFRSSTVGCDSNPIWGDAVTTNSGTDGSRGSFNIPLRKDNLYPALHFDGGRVGLEVRLDEEMAQAEQLLVSGALSTAVGAGVAASGLVGLGKQTQDVSDASRQMLGLSADRLIGRGFVDLMPLLIGLWDEDWDNKGKHDQGHCVSDDLTLNVHGKIDSAEKQSRRRTERMGMLDVWVPLYHSSAFEDGRRKEKIETAGKVHLLITYEPSGMTVRRDDIVAFESFARHPSDQRDQTNSNIALLPIVPPLTPLLVVDIKESYLLLEYSTSRAVTSVDRSGNVKSSRHERSHRVRVHRNAVFVIERKTFMDTAGSLVRIPGDIVMNTPIGQEIAEVSAPIVAATMELAAPAVLWGKLMFGAGGMGLKAGLAGVQAASSAVVSASVEKSLERREEEGGVYNRCN